MDGGSSDPEGPGLDPLIKLHGDIPKFKSDWPPLIFFFGINGNMSDELSLLSVSRSVWLSRQKNTGIFLRLRGFGVSLSSFDNKEQQVSNINRFRKYRTK